MQSGTRVGARVKLATERSTREERAAEVRALANRSPLFVSVVGLHGSKPIADAWTAMDSSVLHTRCTPSSPLVQ